MPLASSNQPTPVQALQLAQASTYGLATQLDERLYINIFNDIIHPNDPIRCFRYASFGKKRDARSVYYVPGQDLRLMETPLGAKFRIVADRQVSTDEYLQFKSVPLLLLSWVVVELSPFLIGSSRVIHGYHKCPFWCT